MERPEVLGVGRKRRGRDRCMMLLALCGIRVKPQSSGFVFAQFSYEIVVFFKNVWTLNKPFHFLHELLVGPLLSNHISNVLDIKVVHWNQSWVSANHGE